MIINFFKNNKTGFTLLELMVSVSIIAIISTLVITDYRRGGSNAELVMTAQKIASDIKLAQSYALSSKDNITNGWGVSFPRGGSEYYLYSDDNGDTVCQGTCGGSSEEFLRVPLRNGMTILDTLGDEGSMNRLHYHFLPPDPQVSICRVNSGQCNYSTGEIVIEDKNGNTISLNINKFGLVDIDK